MATGTRFPGAAAAAAMARLADYFIVVGYDHEKPGKGVGRAPPPASPPPPPAAIQWAPPGWASRPEAGWPAGPRRSRRAVSGPASRPSLGMGVRGRERPGEAHPRASRVPRSSLWVGVLGAVPGPRAGRAGAVCAKLLGDPLCPAFGVTSDAGGRPPRRKC